MLFYSDDLAQAHADQRRQQLLDEARAYRDARAAQAAQPARLRSSDRLLHATGSLLVRWGTHLQQRGRIATSTFVDTRPV